jgi:hypothetical protein
MRYRAPIKSTAILVKDMKPAWACLLFTIILIAGCRTATHTSTVEKPTSAIAPGRVHAVRFVHDDEQRPKRHWQLRAPT